MPTYYTAYFPNKAVYHVRFVLILLYLQAPKPMDSMARFRTVKKRLKDGYHYPQVDVYKFDKEMKLEVPLPLGGNGQEKVELNVKFRYMDTMDAIVSLLLDKSLHGDKEENFVWNAETVRTITGHRLYTRDLNSGQWWEKTERNLPEGAIVLPIMFYSDATLVTQSGSQQAHPIMVTIGNFRWWIRQQNGGWKTVGLVPIVNGSAALKKTPAYKEYKMWQFHECFRRVIKPIIDAHADGGIFLTVCGVERLLVPVVAFFAQDSLEVNK